MGVKKAEPVLRFLSSARNLLGSSFGSRGFSGGGLLGLLNLLGLLGNRSLGGSSSFGGGGGSGGSRSVSSVGGNSESGGNQHSDQFHLVFPQLSYFEKLTEYASVKGANAPGSRLVDRFF